MDHDRPTSILDQLRALIPERSVSYLAALDVAEAQARLLLNLTNVVSAPTPADIVLKQRTITVIHDHAPTRGLTYWNGFTWITIINQREPYPRRRLTLFHEYAHIIWHGHEHKLFPEATRQAIEQAADHFARNCLIPTQLLQQQIARGVLHLGELAKRFEVTTTQIAIRLAETLTEPGDSGPSRRDRQANCCPESP
jgi:Zn-dependent peptidase ImmA (M78 family)